MDYEAWMARARAVIETELRAGDHFEVKQLFPGHEWEALSTGERRDFGRYFSSAGKDGRLTTVERCENGKARQNRYVKREV